MNQDGLLLVDKPEGMTSHDVVARCRRFFSRRDIGHAGTLDPMATGLLVLLVGRATKLSDFILNGDKSYRTTVLLGCETDTDDITGTITKQAPVPVEFTLDEVSQAVRGLSGNLELEVPIYSAMKIKGKKLYERARAGEDFTPPKKMMAFHDLNLIEYRDSRVEIEFTCSKGSFVRAWGKALGRELGCGATLEKLRRVRSAPYDVSGSLALDHLDRFEPEQVYSHPAWIALSQTLPNWPSLKIEGFDEKLVLNGQISRKLERFLELEFGNREEIPGVKLVGRRSGRLICLLGADGALGFKIRRVFPNQ